jgi:hypothetical protein
MLMQIIFYLSVPLLLFLLCLLQDREMDEDMKFLIQYRRIQDDIRRTKIRRS